MPKLDVNSLKKAIAKEQAAASIGLGPGGRPRTGTKAFVRENLNSILQLRTETGATWNQIVKALDSIHDLRQGDGQPITGRHLNALVSACKEERSRKAAAAEARAKRPDLGRSGSSTDIGRRGTNPAVSASDQSEDAPISEDDIRRAQQQRHQHLFKRD